MKMEEKSNINNALYLILGMCIIAFVATIALLPIIGPFRVEYQYVNLTEFVTKEVYINQTIQINHTIEKWNPQHFVVVQNRTTEYYYSFCNTSLNLSTLDVRAMHKVEVGNVTFIDNREFKAVAVNPDTRKLLISINNESRIMVENTSVDVGDRYFTLRELLISTVPVAKAWAFIEVQKK